jgi:hypothetical protein
MVNARAIYATGKSPAAFGTLSKTDVSVNKTSTIRVILLQHAFSVG